MWGPRQGLMFLGFLLAVPALSWAIVQFTSLTKPEDRFSVNNSQNVAEISKLSAAQTWELWQVLREGLNRDEHPDMKDLRLQYAQGLRRVWIAGAFGLVGVGLIVGGFLLRPAQRV